MARANPNANKRKRVIYTVEDVTRLENVLRPTCASNIRNRCIISTLFRTQMRISELLSLRVSDVMLDEAMMYVMFGKGDYQRAIGVPRTGLPILKMWLKARNATLEERGHHSSWFFCCLRRPQSGHQMKYRRVVDMVHSVAERAKMEKRVHLHGFRHSGAFHLIDCGVDIRTIRQQLGHKTLKKTYEYCEGLNPKLQLDVIRTRPRF
jgi:site-specific recombinase XerD